MAASAPIQIRRADALPGGGGSGGNAGGVASLGAQAASLRNGSAGAGAGADGYARTPGGTRIVYTREQLLSLARSPLARSPPAPHQIHASKLGGADGTLPASISASSAGRSPADKPRAPSGGGVAPGVSPTASAPRSFSAARAGTRPPGLNGGGGGVGFNGTGQSPPLTFARRPSGGGASGLPPPLAPLVNGAAADVSGTSPAASRSPGNAFNFATPLRSPAARTRAPSGGGSGSGISSGPPPGLGIGAGIGSAQGGFAPSGGAAGSGHAAVAAAATAAAAAGINRKMSGLALGRPAGA